jgi:hypothetical protein
VATAVVVTGCQVVGFAPTAGSRLDTSPPPVGAVSGQAVRSSHADPGCARPAALSRVAVLSGEDSPWWTSPRPTRRAPVLVELLGERSCGAGR